VAIARQQFNLLAHTTRRASARSSAATRRAPAWRRPLLTYVGVPCIYYGNEIGLGLADDRSRQCMPWDRALWDVDLRAYYQTLIRLRHTSPACAREVSRYWLSRLMCWLTCADTDEAQVIVVANRGRTSGPPSCCQWRRRHCRCTEFTELFTGQISRVSQGQMLLPAAPPGAQIWRTAAPFG